MSIENIILENMYFQGNIRKEDKMSEIYNHYKFEFDRKELVNYQFLNQISNTVGKFKYICTITIRDIISNNIIFSISMNELEAFCFINNLYIYCIDSYGYLNTNYFLVNNVLNKVNLNINSYICATCIEFDSDSEDDSINILDFGNIINNQYISVLKVEFDYDSLNNFMDLIFFTFLVDILDSEILETAYYRSDLSTLDYGLLYEHFSDKY